jgi:hypothetical protein
MLIITAQEVSDLLAITLNDSDVLQAQQVIEAVTGQDLTSVNPELRFDVGDLAKLRAAVTWQTSFLQAHPDVLNRAADVQAVSTNGSSITFDKQVQDGFLAPLAARCLASLSWYSPVTVGTLRPARRRYRDVQPDPWGIVVG